MLRPSTPLYSSMLTMGCGSSAGGGAVPYEGPLDGYTSSLAGAWLPFRGFGSYDGRGFTARDTVGDAEQDVGFDPVTGDLAAFSVGGNAAVRRWYDQSGGGNDLAQASGSAQPLLVTGELAGQAVVRFDGVNDTLPGTVGRSGGLTVYLVVRKVTASNGSYARLLSLTDGVNSDMFYEPSGDKWRYYATSPNIVDDVGNAATTWSLLTHRYAADVCEAYQGGVLVSTFGNGGYDDVTGFHLGSLNGGGFFCQADVGALLIYDAAHDTTTREAIESILMGRFGL